MSATKSASIISCILCLLISVMLVACTGKTTPTSPGSNQDIPFNYEDLDSYYDYPIPNDNDGDWYYNYYNLEY